MLFEILYAFGIVFIVCEISERIINAFTEISNVINQFDSYRFQIKMQRMMPTIVMITQNEIAIEYFGSLSCSRKAFKKVVY